MCVKYRECVRCIRICSCLLYRCLSEQAEPVYVYFPNGVLLKVGFFCGLCDCIRRVVEMNISHIVLSYNVNVSPRIEVKYLINFFVVCLTHCHIGLLIRL